MLNQLVTAMNNEVERLGGEEAALDACERMYSAVFACGEPVKLSDVDDEEDTDDIVTLIKINAFLAFTGKTEDYYGEYLFEAMDSWEDSFVLDKSTLVVDTCNYKGEGEGYALYSKDLPLFAGKRNSFFQVNGH